LYKKVVESDKAEGVERIYFPGEIEQLTEEERLKDGIPFVQEEVDALNAEAEKLGVPKLRVMA
jgi:LDH2 family malate/lactate/ureidoglycolate dehydrogenase